MSYSYERLPPSPDRAIVESTAHSVLGTLQRGGRGPHLGQPHAGLRHQDEPARDGREPVLERPHARRLAAAGARPLDASPSCSSTASTEPSGYDTNAFYVNNSVVLSLTAPGPFETWLRGGVGFLRNDYPNDAPGLGEPRRDDIVGWSLGIGRNLGWRGFVRADYRASGATPTCPTSTSRPTAS